MAERPLIVYLDWNVVIALERGHQHQLLDVLNRGRDAEVFALPFSSTHVSEANRTRSDDEAQRMAWVNEQLDFLSALTANLYLYEGADVVEPRFIEEHPREVLSTITEVTFADIFTDAMLRGLSSPRFLRANRNQVGIDPSKVNSIEPPNVIDQIEAVVKETLRSKWSEDAASQFGVRQLLATALEHYPSNYHGFSNKVAAVFSALNSVGFWPDKGKDDAAISGFSDSLHAASAAYSDVLVSNDKRMRIKSAAAYELFGVGTLVMDSDAFLSRFVPQPA